MVGKSEVGQRSNTDDCELAFMLYRRVCDEFVSLLLLDEIFINS